VIAGVEYDSGEEKGVSGCFKCMVAIKELW